MFGFHLFKSREKKTVFNTERYKFEEEAARIAAEEAAKKAAEEEAARIAGRSR